MPINPTTAHHRAKTAALSRAVRNGERPADDPELADAQRQLKVARLADYIEKQLASAPPLTPTQRDQLAELLRPIRPGARANGGNGR